MRNLKNKVAVITGVASGIGRSVAQLLAKEGCHLALNDYNAAGLAETVASLSIQSDQQVIQEAFDVGDREAFGIFAKKVETTFGVVHLVINNAGVALGRISVEDLEYKDFEWLMNINFWGMVYGTKAFLPLIKKQDEGAIANVSSVFGLAGIGHQSAYCSSKFAIRGFTEALRMEAHLEFPHISIHTIHPGGIDTNIAKSARWTGKELTLAQRAKLDQEMQKELSTSPDLLAQKIIDAIKQKKSRIVYGNLSGSLDFLTRFLPSRYTAIIAKQLSKALSVGK